jgi:hypothetical protein
VKAIFSLFTIKSLDLHIHHGLPFSFVGSPLYKSIPQQTRSFVWSKRRAMCNALLRFPHATCVFYISGNGMNESVWSVRLCINIWLSPHLLAFIYTDTIFFFYIFHFTIFSFHIHQSNRPIWMNVFRFPLAVKDHRTSAQTKQTRWTYWLASNLGWRLANLCTTAFSALYFLLAGGSF